MLRRHPVLTAVLLLLALAVSYLLLWPVRVEPEAWTPPPAPELSGVYEPNSRLARVERLGEGEVGDGPEDVAVDGAGRVYAGVRDGHIMRLAPGGRGAEVFADTGGRPLGLRFDAEGNLLVCDALLGLLSVAPGGAVQVLSTEAGGVPFLLADDLDVAADGTVYFSDASAKFSLEDNLLDFLEHGANGRLLAYDPRTRETRVLLDKLYFANGVAVSPDQSFVLVAESSAYRIRRYWLAGERRGQSDFFAENLPGFPDGVLSNGRDKFWVALAAPRDATLDRMLPHPFARKVAARLPASLLPAPRDYAFVLGLSLDGRVVENLQDPSLDAYAPITNAVEHDGALYLGSLSAKSVGRLPLR